MFDLPPHPSQVVKVHHENSQACPCPDPPIGPLCAPIYPKWEWTIALGNLLDTILNLAFPSLGVFPYWAGAQVLLLQWLPPSRMCQALAGLNTAEK